MTESSTACYQVAFSALDDHCTYTPERVFASMSQAELATLRSVFDGELPILETTGDFYNVAQELDDRGHDDLATKVAQWNHDERLYECACYERAVNALVLEVGQVAASISAAYPAALHLLNDRLVWDLGDELLDEELQAALRARTCEYFELALDERGDGTRTVDDTAVLVRSLMDSRARYAQFLADDEILDFSDADANDSEVDGFTATGTRVVELHEWLDLPAPVADLMAAVHQQDSWVCDAVISQEFSGLHGTDLMFSQLRTIAETTVSRLSDTELAAVRRLLATSKVAILDAVEAVAS